VRSAGVNLRMSKRLVRRGSIISAKYQRWQLLTGAITP